MVKLTKEQAEFLLRICNAVNSAQWAPEDIRLHADTKEALMKGVESEPTKDTK